MSREPRTLSWCFAVAAVVAAIAWHQVSATHYWGDDFAGYLLQARALAGGAPEIEVATNRELMAESDKRVGPDAYPWGYPAMLALVGSNLSWDLQTLKLVAVGSLALASVFVLLLARVLGTGWALAVLCSSATVLQPAVLDAVDRLESDVPFLAVSTAATFVSALILRRVASGAQVSLALVLFAAFLGAVGFGIRSNGFVLCAALPAVLLMMTIVRKPTSISALMRVLAAYCVGVLIFVGAYFAALPDGSLVHVGYLSLDPTHMLDRLFTHARQLGDFLPMAVLPTSFERIAAVAFVLVAMWCALSLGPIGWLLASSIVGHFALLTAFPADGGARYYFPILAPLFLIAVAVLERQLRAFDSSLVRAVSASRISSATAALITLGLGALALRFDSNRALDLRYGPYSPEAQQLFAAVSKHVSRNELVGFFKPRAMRLATGRHSILVRNKTSVPRVAYLVLTRYPGEEAADQLSPADLRSSHSLTLIYSNSAFWLFAVLGKPEKGP